eukprot:6051704-Alexandrium_andersonii.AAC.1
MLRALRDSRTRMELLYAEGAHSEREPQGGPSQCVAAPRISAPSPGHRTHHPSQPQSVVSCQHSGP